MALTTIIGLAAAAVLLLTMASCAEPPLPTTPVVEMPPPDAGQLQTDPDRPSYWRFRGETVMLLGGSVEDNLFQLPPDELDAHLDLLVSVGGNYVRCTMSCRDEGNVQPHHRDPDTGRYDLERWGDEYWRRFEHFLRATAARGVVVQIEVWDRFDLAREPWLASSFNPVNNINYTAEDTGLAPRYDEHPGLIRHPFFRTPPGMADPGDKPDALLRHQQRFVDRLLDATLAHDHVLYCIDNETAEPAAWAEYWAIYMQRRAASDGKRIYCTEMWDPWALDNPMHRRTTDRPDLYAFIEVSQNNHKRDDEHYTQLTRLRQRVVNSGVIRPLNNVKVYGADGGRHGTTAGGVRSYWQNILGGAASTRFHRPPSGVGLSDIGQTHIRSARMFVDAFDLFASQPTRDVFAPRHVPGSAYCLHHPDHTYALFFPDGGQVTLRVADHPRWSVRWLDIERSAWRDAETRDASRGKLDLATPATGLWAAVVTRQ
jgi:hypothetical protein